MRICCCLLLRIWDALASKMRESAEPRYEADTGSDTSIHLSLQIIRLIAPKHFNISPHQSFWGRNYSSKSLIIVFYFHSCIGATVSVYFQQSRSSIQTLVLLLFFHQSCEMLRIWWIYPCKKMAHTERWYASSNFPEFGGQLNGKTSQYIWAGLLQIWKSGCWIHYQTGR